MSYKENVIEFKGSFPLIVDQATDPISVSGYLSAQVALYGTSDLVVQVQGLLAKQPSKKEPREEDWLTKQTITGKGFFDMPTLPSLVRLKVSAGTLTSAALDASPDAAYAVTGVASGAVGGGVPPVAGVTPEQLEEVRKSILPPRGTGGTPGRLVTRTGNGDNFINLTPTSPISEFATGRVAFLGVDGPIYAGQTGKVTGYLTGGKSWRLGAGGVLVEMPNPIPSDYPDASILNNNTRYYDGLETYNSGTEVYLYHAPTATVTLPTTAAPVAPPAENFEKLAVQTLPYNTNLVGTDVIQLAKWDQTKIDGIFVVRADGDAGQPAGMALSAVTRSLSGVTKGVFGQEKNTGVQRLSRPATVPARLGGDILMRFQNDNLNWNIAELGIVIGYTGTALDAVYHELLLTGNTSPGVTMNLRKVTAAAGVFTPGTTLFTVGSAMTRTAFAWTWVRVRVNPATKTVSARMWLDTVAEPATWDMTDVAAPDLSAGYAGWRSKDSYLEINVFKTTVSGVIPSV